MQSGAGCDRFSWLKVRQIPPRGLSTKRFITLCRSSKVDARFLPVLLVVTLVSQALHRAEPAGRLRYPTG
jgi:hypothetical protein